MSQIDMNNWLYPYAPAIDEDGTADFTQLYNEGYIQKFTTRSFDPARQYLFPIPSKDIQINPSLEQNPGY